ncbi:hypothetical protein RRG08_007912 [Elysia crispata]|uniref:Uncharacterized protein n=1 Tax=Elysia crispata TaxID=231223 RepID=A0AAE0ZPW8_9GAST|nr:hypothetical protein RRG08_007912 [Elysia crispata]
MKHPFLLSCEVPLSLADNSSSGFRDIIQTISFQNIVRNSSPAVELLVYGRWLGTARPPQLVESFHHQIIIGCSIRFTLNVTKLCRCSVGGLWLCAVRKSMKYVPCARSPFSPVILPLLVGLGRGNIFGVVGRIAGAVEIVGIVRIAGAVGIVGIVRIVGAIILF